MKKLLLAAIVSMAALNAHAQEKETTIEVRGMAKITREVESYLIDFAIAVDYGEMEGRKSFEDLKSAFFTKAKAAGLEESRFKEDKMGFQALQLYREGSLYTFETRNKDELLKAAKLANGGGVITIAGTRLKFRPLKDQEKLFDTAFRNGKERATGIAKVINKKPGTVVSITEYAPLDTGAEDNFYYKQPVDQDYYLIIRFTIE